MPSRPAATNRGMSRAPMRRTTGTAHGSRTLAASSCRTVSSASGASWANDLLVESDCRPRLISHDGLPYHLHYKPLAGDLAARVKAFTAAGLAYLVAEGWGSRLGRCQRAGCATAFVDTSRNGTRRFGSDRCANQVNVTNHRERSRTWLGRPGQRLSRGAYRCGAKFPFSRL
jgi:hypothetical protein